MIWRPAALLCLAAGLLTAGQGVIDLDRSPHARLRTVPVRAVRLEDGFWAPRRRVNVERSLPTMLQLLEEHGIVDNFRRLSAGKQVPRRGPVYTDSDVYKWMEAAAFVLQSEDRPDLRAAFERLTDEILAVQEPGGYLNTYYVDDRASRRFSEMQRGHELYCLGHLLQAAVAYYRAAGSRRLLDGGLKFVEYLIRDFGPDKRPLLTGHPELEMALVEVYRITGDRRHLDLAAYLLRGDGERIGLAQRDYVYLFSGKPFTSRTKFEGHAVRALYAANGAADYYLETGDPAYWKTLNLLWEDLARRKIYITGGVGARAAGEAFGEAYELPDRAYSESCAAIAGLMFNWRMLHATGEARFTDLLERALYNGINSGMSLNGTLYCYRNPLALDAGDKVRNPWYDTTCCPPNLQRLLASLPGYFYSTAAGGLYVHLYHNSILDWQGLRVTQKTDYPWGDAVDLTLAPEAPKEFTLYLRIPGWTTAAQAAVNGRPVAGARPGAYLPIHRTWQAGDRVRLTFDLRPQLVAANPLLREAAGRVAVQRGPLVYCLEQLDQPPGRALADLSLASAELKPEFRKDLLGGVWVLRGKGAAWQKPLAQEPLYEPAGGLVRPAVPVELTFIPYYTFANREPTAMQVWIPLRTSSR